MNTAPSPPHPVPQTSDARRSREPFARTLTRLLKKHEQVLGILPPGFDPLDLADELSPNIFLLGPSLSPDDLAEELDHIQERLQEDRRVHILCTADFPRNSLRPRNINILRIDPDKG